MRSLHHYSRLIVNHWFTQMSNTQYAHIPEDLVQIISNYVYKSPHFDPITIKVRKVLLDCRLLLSNDNKVLKSRYKYADSYRIPYDSDWDAIPINPYLLFLSNKIES